MKVADPSVASAFDLLGLGLAPRDEARRGRLEALAKKFTPWETLAKLAQDRHVATQLYATFHGAGLEALIPESLREALHKLYLQTAAGNTLRLHQALQISSRLAERGIPVLFLKGASLVLAGDYPNPGHRLFSDVDVLVDPAHQAETDRVFKEAGSWQQLAPAHSRNWKQTQWINSWGTMIEVHWRLYSFNAVPSELVEQRMWAAARQVRYRGHPAWVPAPEDRFIQAALHGTAHHGFDTAFLFISLADMARLAGGRTEALDWSRLAKNLRAERMLEHVAVATELAWELTRFEPLQQGLAIFRAEAPHLQAITSPLLPPLLRVLRQSQPFSSKPETRLLAQQPWPARLRLAVYLAAVFLFPALIRRRKVPGGWIEIPTLNLRVLPQRRRLNRSWIAYWWRLAQFYRRIGYTGIE